MGGIVSFIAARNMGKLALKLTGQPARRGLPLLIEWRDDSTPAVLGIDPGLSGAVVALTLDGKQLLGTWAMPTVPLKGRGRIKRRVDGAALCDIYARGNIAHAFVEDPGVVMGGAHRAVTSPLSVAALHATLGNIEGALDVRGIPSSRVHPSSWKRPYGLWGKGDKRASLDVAMQLWPDFGPLRMKDNGHAEAALIARYGLTHTIWKE